GYSGPRSVRIRGARHRPAPRQTNPHRAAEGAPRAAPEQRTQASGARHRTRRHDAAGTAGRRVGVQRFRRNARKSAPHVTFIARIAHAIMLASGWQRAAAAFLAGAFSAAAMAPLTFWPVLFLTFPVLVWLVDGSASGRISGVWRAAG